MIKDIIVDKLCLNENDFLLVNDPDDLLSTEGVVDAIVSNSFLILSYDDPEAFRYYYEANIRSVIDSGRKLDKKFIIRCTDIRAVPYDIQLKCFHVELSLREMFPKLSYNVIKELYTDMFDRLYNAYQSYHGPVLGDNGTKEFILKNVFGIIPEVIFSFQDIIKAFILLYYKGDELPKPIADYAVEILNRNAKLAQFPIKTVVYGRDLFFHFIQEQWEIYVKQLNGENVKPIVDFNAYEIRVYMDNLFEENLLTPVKQQRNAEYPAWVEAGIIFDIAGSVQRKYKNEIEKINGMLQNIKSYKDWFIIAKLWADIMVLEYNYGNDYLIDHKKYKDTHREINKSFKSWMFRNYGMLASLSFSKAPVMVHKIPWYINYRCSIREDKRIALIVMDGMSLDDWYVIKNSIDDKKYIFEESMCFAWVPTITSISRQAIFSGEVPASFADSMFSTNYDNKGWKKFWRDAGYNDSSIVYKRNIKEFSENGLYDILGDNKVRILGLVVNIVDDIMHGQQLSIDGMHQDVELWAKKKYLKNFIDDLFIHGFEVYITSDHGNIASCGQGTMQEGLAVESAGERLRIYKNGISCDAMLSKFKAFKWNGAGLSDKYNYILCEDDYAFIKEDRKIISHGGLSVEEVIVPFIHIRKENKNA